MVVVPLITTLIAADRRAQFGSGSFDDIEAALTTRGMAICTTVTNPDGQANQAIESRQYDVAFRCPTENDAQVIVNQFGSVSDRDTAMPGCVRSSRSGAFGRPVAARYTHRKPRTLRATAGCLTRLG